MDFVKIDGNLVRDIESDQIDRSIVESIQAMAQLLKIRTVAENVDDERPVARLREIGLDYAQGYYLGDSLDQLGVDMIRQPEIQPTDIPEESASIRMSSQRKPRTDYPVQTIRFINCRID